MEALLSLAFDYLSSYDTGKIRKGLRQVEGLLAQLCLYQSKTPDRRASLVASPKSTPEKDLAALHDDPAFREFFKLQDGFEWNVALRLISCLERLLGKGSNGQNDLLILSTLDLIQGTLLLHPPSRSLFAREIYMNLLLDLLDPYNCPAIQSSTLLTLVCALLDKPENTRTFEALDGLLTVTSLFKIRSTTREVKMRLIEFLYFYLMAEGPDVPASMAGLHRSPSKASRLDRSRGGDSRSIKTTEEKQVLLSKFLNNVDDLVDDLRGGTPFATNR